MIKVAATYFFCLMLSLSVAQPNLVKEIKEIQLDNLYNESCLDFIRTSDVPDHDISGLQQIIIIRHGEPAMNKRGWKSRDEAIQYAKMYDSVGIYDFDQKPICLRENDLDTIYTSLLPRAIDTAEKTMGDSTLLAKDALFNEFERKIIRFPNIVLPRQFWSVASRSLWIIGFNNKGIESFSEARERSRKAARFLDEKSNDYGKVLLFAHGFMNKFIKKYLRKMGYNTIDLDGQEYLGAYYFYKIN